MRIACLQFAPHVADVENNLSKADEILNQIDAESLEVDLLVLPELAFTGYNFKSLAHISPYLEECSTGISSLWARNTALKHDCTVVVGYPEKVDPALNWPTDPQYYNSAITVNGDGETVANYRKVHLYYTDETWALEGSHGFLAQRIPDLGQTAMGICMDLNPYKFEAPWNKFEFGQHVLDSGARLVVVPMAWLTNDEQQEFLSALEDPDTMSLLYWVSRLEPLIRAQSNQEVIVVFANRCGTEGETTYVGTSAVIGIQSGEIYVYGIMGRGETGLLVVDTDSEPYARLAYQPLQPVVRSDNDGSPELEAGSRNNTAQFNDSQNQAWESPEKPKDRLTNSAHQRENDLHAWYGNAANNANERQHHQSSKYDEEHDYHSSNKPKANHVPQVPSPKLNIESLQLDIPADQYMLRRYLESESPVSHIDTFNPSMQSITSPEPFRGLRKDRDDYVAFYPDNMEDEKRFSMRSDVSVWNNQPGRPRQASVSMVALSGLSHVATHERSRNVEIATSTRLQGGNKSRNKAHSQRRSSDWNSRRDSEYGQPISRQSSHYHLQEHYNQSHNDEMARSYSSSTVLPLHLLQSHTASQATPDEVGRGRRRSSHKHPKDRRRGSRSTQMSNKEPIDLSQFTLIEEYPSASCPVHGSRPASGTRRQSHSKVRGRSENRSQPVPEAQLARKQSNRRMSSQNERHRSGYGLSHRPIHSTRPELEHLTRERKRDERESYEEHSANIISGPKTPTAMLLIPDLELPDGLEKTFSLLKCVEKAPEHIVRRRVSSFW
ncbi:protein N-terminal amidase [Trichoderma asperellum]|nr:carbon-nitrogen hydrolase [Trichoderma asperelloides]